MLPDGACPGSSFTVYSDRCLQMDRVYCSKDKTERKETTEDLNAREEIWRSVFEPYVPLFHGDSGCVGYYSTPETSPLTEHPIQTKILDRRPPTSQAELDASVASTLSLSRNLLPIVWSKVSERLF